jgi:hypothetical protein
MKTNESPKTPSILSVFFPCDVYISAGFLSDDCGGYCPAQVAKLEGRMKFIVSPQDPPILIIIIKYLYGVRWIGTDSILLSERRPHAARFYGASRCHCY